MSGEEDWGAGFAPEAELARYERSGAQTVLARDAPGFEHIVNSLTNHAVRGWKELNPSLWAKAKWCFAKRTLNPRKWHRESIVEDIREGARIRNERVVGE